MSYNQGWLPRLCGVLSGLLMMLPHLYGWMAPLQLIALLPILWVLSESNVKKGTLVTAAVYMALAYTIPQMLILQMPPEVTAILLLWFTVLLLLFVFGGRYVIRESSILSSVAIAAWFVVIDWINFTTVPIWGTAQSFIRPWSSYPLLITFISITGVTGISFSIVFLQNLFVCGIQNKKLSKAGLVSGLFVLLIIVLNVALEPKSPGPTVKLAALGWSGAVADKYDGVDSEEGFDTLIAEPLTELSGMGVQLVVAPEMTLYFGDSARYKWIARLGELAKNNHLMLVIGYINYTSNLNRLLCIDDHGQLAGEYTKVHLTPFEKTGTGNGELMLTELDGVQVGAMICQDDNFTDLSRAYGQEGVDVMAVPTMDWPAVSQAHLQNSIFRSIESHYTVVRAAINGVSAIISPRGIVLARYDHNADGAGFAVADVQGYAGTTFFSRSGHFWVGVCGAYFLLFAIRSKIKRKKHMANFCWIQAGQ